MNRLLPILLCSCNFGPSFFDCVGVDEEAGRAIAVERGVLDVYERLDVFCEPRADVGRDCHNDTAEACLVWRGSTVHRARMFASSEATEGVMPLLEHELAAHATDTPEDDACTRHPNPACDGLPDG